MKWEISDIERMLDAADFSWMTDLKERLLKEIMSNPDRAYTREEQAEGIDKADP